MDIGNYIVRKAKKLGVDDIVCTITSGTTRQIKFANNEIILNTTWDTIDAEVFLAYKKRLISSTFGAPSSIENYPIQHPITALNEKSIDEFLTRMVKIAKIIEPKEDYNGIAEGPFKYNSVKNSYDKKIEKLDGKEIDFVQKAVDKALSEGAERCAGVLYSNSGEVRVVSSNDIDATDKGSGISISIRAFADGNASGHSVSVSRMLNKFEPKKAGEEAGSLAKQSIKPSVGESGKYNVILGPMVMANILYYMSYAFSAFEVESGMSFLIDKIDKKIGNDIVTIVDDGRLENGYFSRKFDEEGRPTQRTELVKNGVLKNYLHNTTTAKKFKVKPTGNAGIIYPQPWNLVLESGDSSLDEMISQVKRGVYITNVWYTRFSNYRTGDFSTIPRDAMFEIIDGKITRPITGLRLGSNMQKVLENIVAISKENKTINWWEVERPVVTGYVLCKNLDLTKATK